MRSLIAVIIAAIFLEPSARCQQPVQLSLRPAAEPVPSLRYRIHHSRFELKAGSADAHLKTIKSTYQSLNGDDRDVFLRFKQTPQSINEQELQKQLSKHEVLLEPLHNLAVCSFQEREPSYDVKPEDFWSREIFEVGIARDVTLFLQLKIARSESLDEALSLVSDGLRLGEYISHGPSLVEHLTAAAINNLMIDSVQDVMTRYPDANLYWALSGIPLPMTRFSEVISTELHVMLEAFPELREENLRLKGKDNAYWIGQYQSMLARISLLGDKELPTSLGTIAALHMTQVESAKKLLQEQGYSKEEINSWPAAQVIMVNMRASLKQITQDLEKLTYIDLRNAAFVHSEEQRIIDGFFGGSKATISPAGMLFSILYPSIPQTFEIKAHQAEVKLNRLITAEAVRMHAAINHQLPEKLSDIKTVVTRLNPMTGEPFEYLIEPMQAGHQQFALSTESAEEIYKIPSLKVVIDFSEQVP